MVDDADPFDAALDRFDRRVRRPLYGAFDEAAERSEVLGTNIGIASRMTQVVTDVTEQSLPSPKPQLTEKPHLTEMPRTADTSVEGPARSTHPTEKPQAEGPSAKKKRRHKPRPERSVADTEDAQDVSGLLCPSLTLL